ncbi:DUF342 domain-containing protein [Thalassotalea sp. PLHSN55]|uniref:DUF342 domain-containing protein n=1 Tax=Thalassotalea sp. PLHSN55 TaxID=3435888 RepID=UPI003F84ADBF
MTVANLVTNKNNHVDLVLIPKKDNKVISEANIHELIKASEFSDLHLEMANVKNAVAELNGVLKPLQANQEASEIRYQILERRDASITINIDSDEMGCSAEITTALGGKHLSAKAILHAAQAAGITKGFSKEELIKLARAGAKEPAGSIVKAQIAWGKEPVNGKDSQIKPLVESAQNRILKPKEREDGSVDMRDLGDIICVKVGDPLAQKIPFTQGKKGFTVTGNPLEPVPGEDIELKAGEGTTISPKNQNVLVSTLVGLPRVIDNGMEVDEVYKLKNVDISTGHIKFQGSVIIDGDVCEGMKVSATGDITIGGFVESSFLDAGGDITIGTGIIGKKYETDNVDVKDINMSVKINAKGNIFAKYCQYAEINCQDLRIENQMMHSIINVNGQLWVGNEEHANGKLIAGHIHAGTSVHAGCLGATAGAPTIITFDKRIDEYKDEIDAVDKKIKEESDQTEELKGAINKLKLLPKDKQQPELLKKVVTTYKFHAGKLAEDLQEKAMLEDLLQEYMGQVFVEATEKLYHGVELVVGDFRDRSRREYGPSKMKYSERKIHIEPIVHT